MALDISCSYYFEVTSATGANGMAAQETGFALAFDLALLGTSHGFWSHVKSDGGDVRAAKVDGTTQLALHVVEIDVSGKKGLLRFNDTSPTAATTWRIYYGNVSASQPAASGTYGANNAYGGSSCLLAMPLAGTPADYSATPVTVASDSSDAETTTVKIGKSCRKFTRNNSDKIDLGKPSKLGFTGTAEFTIMTLSRPSSSCTDGQFRLLYDKGDQVAHLAHRYIGTHQAAEACVWDTNWRSIYIESTYTVDEWHSNVLRCSSSDFNLYVDGTAGTARSHGSMTSLRDDNVFIGENSQDAGRCFDGYIQMLEIYNSSKSANFITSWHRMMMANTSFWPTVGAEQTTTTTQTISPSGISDAENFGTPKTTLGVVASGIASAFASGTAVLQIFALAAGIAGAEAIGSPSVGLTIHPSGTASAEALGSPALKLYALPSGIGTGEAVGGPSIAFRVAPGGIGSAEAIGGALLVLYLVPGGLAGGEAFGAATLALFVLPGGISGAEAVGTPSISHLYHVLPGGIPSGEGFGVASLPLSILPAGIDSAEAFGGARVVLYVLPSGIATGAALGDLSVGFAIGPAGIPGAEGFGDFVTAFRIYPAGINSGETFGTFRAGLFALPSGISSGEALGDPSVVYGVAPGGIPGAGALGVPSVDFGVAAAGIPSGEAIGVPSVALSIVAVGIPSAEAIGDCRPALIVSPAGIPGAEAFGDFDTAFRIFPDGLVSGEGWGLPAIWKPGAIYIPAIASAEAFGVPRLASTQFILVGGIPSAQAVGAHVAQIIGRSAFFQIVENDFEVGIFNTDEFAETVLYVYKNGGQFTLRAIFDNEYIQILPEGGAAVQSNHPQIWVQASKFQTRPGPEDRVQIRGAWFRVVTFEPDGTGLAQLVLHRERTV